MLNETKKELYIISPEEYQNKIQPSWNEKSTLIFQAALFLGNYTPETMYSIGLRIEEYALNYPDNLALLFEDQKYTYKEFNESINRYANFFLNYGLKKGDRIVIVDDVLSTGGTLIAVLTALKQIGVVVKEVFIAIDKGNVANRIMNETKVKITAIANIDIVNGKVVIK